ncbi:hypothetical protein EXIGLDRAFT_828280 [Exidia glandulosa HHB12029]|uniref:Protein kinase domain-containing protein n=1 Tax=Exidia glandulosa HHB12029 TaxID=1314781 RepID=A0A165R2J0_EXIGL|nr:hypothetical protein EXIGLDRAFT_828280 [Exidia glandulosa HHB12029]
MQVPPHSFLDLYRACSAPDAHPRTIVWEQFASFFASNGLHIWNAIPGRLLAWAPPDSRPRAPDGFSYRSPTDVDRSYDFCQQTIVLCPARTIDGRDVVIRIVRIGDEGKHHEEALRRLATGNVASVIGNHTAPVLQWLSLNAITFAVFPYLSSSDPTCLYLYEDTRDLLGHLDQMLEALEFCHARLIAHRDVFQQNFLCNFYGGIGFDRSAVPPPVGELVRPFRSLFPFRIYLIDFEWAICFDPESDPATRVVRGLPLPPDKKSLGAEYTRPIAPEMTSGLPYDPFLTDVWQLGTYFQSVAEENIIPAAALRLFKRMAAVSPLARPTAREALVELREIKSSLTLDEMRTPVWIRDNA